MLAIFAVAETPFNTSLDVQAILSETPPEEASVIFGDAVHNARTALDILANDLVALSGTVPKNVYFPFANSKEGLEEQITSKMRGATGEVREIVRALAPYKGEGGNKLLRAMHDLDIRDKHLAAISVSTTAESSGFKVVSTAPPRFDLASKRFSPIPLRIIPQLKTLGPDYRWLGVMDDARFEATISPGLPLAGEPAIGALNEIADLVESIIETFEAHILRHDQAPPTTD